jgi:hypothetical protein
MATQAKSASGTKTKKKAPAKKSTSNKSSGSSSKVNEVLHELINLLPHADETSKNALHAKVDGKKVDSNNE